MEMTGYFDKGIVHKVSKAKSNLHYYVPKTGAPNVTWEKNHITEMLAVMNKALDLLEKAEGIHLSSEEWDMIKNCQTEESLDQYMEIYATHQ